MSLRNAYTSFDNKATDLSADYKRKFKRNKEELGISLLYSNGNNNTYYSQSQQYLANNMVFSGSQSKNPGKDHLSSIAIDYADPVTNNFLLETGVKAETETLISDATVFTFSPSTNDYLFDNSQSYSSTFKRQVYSAYASASFSLFKQLNIISGLRLEHTVNTAFYSNSGKADIPDYNNLCPSFTISHTFEKKQLIKFSYAYRLERPEYRDLNPFVNLSDPHNISTGNPHILPEIGHDYQLGFNQDFGKENNLNITLVFTHNSPDIKSYTSFYPSYKVGDSTYYNVNVTSRSNIASENRYGININGAFVIAGKLTLRPGIQLYNRQINNIYSIPQKINGFEYRGNINCKYQLNKSFVMEVFGNYRSGTKWQGTQAAFYSYSIAMRHQLFKGKGSVGFVAVNAFGKYFTQRTSQEAVGFTASTKLQIPYRSFGINFLYKFGKLKINKPKEAENLLNNPPPDSQ